jgi:hypothetical protein
MRVGLLGQSRGRKNESPMTLNRHGKREVKARNSFSTGNSIAIEDFA